MSFLWCFRQKKDSINLDKNAKNRVITGIPVEMASKRSKIGEIELDLNIEDKSKEKTKPPELVVYPKV